MILFVVCCDTDAFHGISVYCIVIKAVRSRFQRMYEVWNKIAERHK